MKCLFRLTATTVNFGALGVALGISMPCALAENPISVDFSKGAGSVEFRATGHPSSLHVIGKGPGPTGQILVSKAFSDGVLYFDLTSLDTANESRDDHMKNKYLEVGKYPTAQLTISKMQLSQEFIQKPFVLTPTAFQGILFLHGVSKPVTGTVSIKGDGKGTLELDSKFGLKLSDFEISIPSFAGITVADEVQVKVMSTPHFALKN